MFSDRVFDPRDVRGISMAATCGGRNDELWVAELVAAQRDHEDSRSFREFRHMAKSNRGTL